MTVTTTKTPPARLAPCASILIACCIAACDAPRAGQVALVLAFGSGVHLDEAGAPYTLRIAVLDGSTELAAAEAELGSAANLVLADLPVGADRRAHGEVRGSDGAVRLVGDSAAFVISAGVEASIPLLLVDTDGWRCAAGACAPRCGDNLLRGDESCDDGGTVDGDGCSAACRNEPGFVCGGGQCLAVPEVEVPGGAFSIGCNDDACPSSEIGHPVDVPRFFVDQTEVTVLQFRHCIDAGRCRPPGTGDDCNAGRDGVDDHPQNCVDWQQARSFCAFAGKELCTEAQWEKAARGDDGRLYPWGDAPAASCERAVMLDVDATGERGCGAPFCTLPVGSRPLGASPFGALDLVGNVTEWVLDCFEDSYVGAPLDGSARTECPVTGDGFHVQRGDSCAAGDFVEGVEVLNARTRNLAAEHDVKATAGFRCCRWAP